MNKKINNKYFTIMIINGFVTRLNPTEDNWKQIWKTQLRGIAWETYLQWLIECISTIIKNGDIIAMEFKKEFKSKNKEYHVTMIYEGEK